MTVKEQLMQELEHIPDTLLEQVLDFVRVMKQRHSQELTPQQQSVLERMGGIPKHLLSDGTLSDRDTRRSILESRIKKRQHQ